jgi:hypothetical protein
MNKLVEKIRNGEVDFFDPINFEELKFDKLKKAELIEILKILNERMIASLDNWEGG